MKYFQHSIINEQSQATNISSCASGFQTAGKNVSERNCPSKFYFTASLFRPLFYHLIPLLLRQKVRFQRLRKKREGFAKSARASEDHDGINWRSHLPGFTSCPKPAKREKTLGLFLFPTGWPLLSSSNKGKRNQADIRGISSIAIFPYNLFIYNFQTKIYS